LQQLAVAAAFAALLGVGLAVFRDYGISWDEELSRTHNGLPNYLYLAHGDRARLENTPEKYHGPAFEIVLMFAEKGLRLEDSRPAYFVRHLLTFLLFYAAVLAFYGTLRRRLDSRWLGLAGALFLVLSPRIFADAFYNSKDLAFLAAYLLALASLSRFLHRPTWGNALLHAVGCGFAVAIRIVAVVVPFLTVVVLAAQVFARRKRGDPANFPWRLALGYSALMAGFTTLFWPALWPNPVLHFAYAFWEMASYAWNDYVLYLGREVRARELPWHYVPVWVGVTTPVFYTLLFFVGLGRLGREIARRRWEFVAGRPEDLAWLGALVLPVGAVIGLRSTLYDGWRHLYFVYPPMLYVAVLGFAALAEGARRLTQRFRPALPVFLVGCAVPLLATAWAMVRDHPYQNIYFNYLAGPDMQTIKGRFEMDYWGLSCREGLERLLAADPSPEITVYADGECAPPWDIVLILTPEQRARLRYVDRPEEAKYLLSHYRHRRKEFPAERDSCTVCVGNAKVFVAQRLR
jgi:hypothetical protein